MFSQKERTYVLAFVSLLALFTSVALVLLAEFFPVSVEMWAICVVFFCATVVLAVAGFTTIVFSFARAYWLESRTTAHMFAVGQGEIVVESRPVGESVVRSGVTGAPATAMTISPEHGRSPKVNQAFMGAPERLVETPVEGNGHRGG